MMARGGLRLPFSVFLNLPSPGLKTTSMISEARRGPMADFSV